MTSVARTSEQDDSGEYSDASQDVETSNSLNDGQQESEYDSQGSDSDHSEREPENQDTTERRVDDDEDRSNPQYIPKRGTFYEHDDRTAASGEESTHIASETASEKKEGSETPSERRRPPRKSDIVNKWSHDKYIENEQIPKTRDELVSIYGYDIRNEEAPPHARRNRRYGRGPNKYTRTWEDEEAYRRQNAVQQPRKPPNPEDFPELEASVRKPGRKPRAQRPRSKSQPASNDSSDSVPQLRRNASIKTARPKPTARPIPVRNMAPRSAPKPQEMLPPIENLSITSNLNNSQGQIQRKVSSNVAQQRPVPTDFSVRKPKSYAQHLNNSVMNNKPSQQQQAQQKPQQMQKQQQQQQQPAEGRGGSKRYSSLRQRPLGDTYTPQSQSQQQSQQLTQQQLPQQQQQQLPQQQPQQQPPQQQQPPHRYHAGSGEYPTAGSQVQSPTNVPQPHAQHPQHIIHPVLRNASVPPAGHAPSPPHQSQQLPPPPPAHTQQARLGLLDQPQLVPHHTIHNMPQPHPIGQIPPPAQGYAPPAMMPAQYMQSGTGPVYGGGAIFAQPPPPAPYTHTHQIYTPHHNYATQAGGVTYYNCADQEQQQMPPARSHRRPTAAIPIVRPQQLERPANATEKENIDRIVENMFVRKPWPAAQGSDKEKSAEPRSSQEPTSKESSQPNSLTSSSISTDSTKPSDNKDDTKTEEVKEDAVNTQSKETEVAQQESIPTIDA